MFIIPIGIVGEVGLYVLTLLISIICILAFTLLSTETAVKFFAYHPDTLNVWTMFSSAFMHESIFHLLGNLFFFFCFSSIIERRVTPLGYLLIFAFITVFQNTIYHITSINNGIAIPSIGLSGVVWGYMALFLTLTPKANVDCFVWYLWVIKRVEIPAWIFILGFFALDIGAFRENDSSNVNHIAHFGGFVAGILARVLIVPLVSVKQNARSRLSKRTKPSW